ncbi:hypothetical protein [[Kitasatospora] papulosa]|uniref:hypothetical protein n=1 Tax=[Kitasatospora] papulosa TaxID=1464011 RepID=UPI00368E2AB2
MNMPATADSVLLARDRVQYYWCGLRVPFIAMWSHETALRPQVIRASYRGVWGIGYTDKLEVADRRHGALWVRRAVARGKGTPALAGVHPLRQRQAMAHLLCQVCGNSTFDEHWKFWGERHLFLMRALDPGQVISDGETTDSPPVPLPCALESVEACSHIRQGWTAALVKDARPWGVAGVLHDPLTLAPKIGPGKRLIERPFGHEEYAWINAARELVQLEGVTPVDLHKLAAETTSAGIEIADASTDGG